MTNAFKFVILFSSYDVLDMFNDCLFEPVYFIDLNLTNFDINQIIDFNEELILMRINFNDII